MLFDYSEQIKKMLTMRQVAQYYGFSVSCKTNKMLCPFHNDSNASLVVYPGDRGYYCYSCNAGGDVIDFVMRLFNLDFVDACKKLDQDFCLHLGIGEKQTKAEREAAERAFRKRQDDRRKREERRRKLQAEYNIYYNRFAYLDMLKILHQPTDPDAPISDEYAFACRCIDQAWEDVQEAEARIRKFEGETAHR